MRASLINFFRGLVRLLFRLFLILVWFNIKLLHEITGILEELLKKRIESP